MMPPRPPSSPDPSLVLLSPAQARRLLDDARGLASEGRPVAALQALLAALAALGAPSAALQVFGRAVEALTLRREGEGGGGGGGGAGAGAEAAGGQRGERAAAEVSAPLPSSSLASLLASLSLEASTRLGALEGEKTGEGEGGSMALDGGAGPTPHPAAAAAAAVPALLSEEAAARADGSGWRCPCCLGLCNCSAVSCQRKLCGLRDTGQLEHEARQFGFRSVAHYLVLTQLDP